MNGSISLESRKQEEECLRDGGEDDFSASICRTGLNGNHEPYSKARAPKVCAYFPCRRDFGPHRVLPVKIHQPEPFVPSEEDMDLLTTYKQDYNPYPVSRVDPIKPQDSKYPRGGKMECLPTYKGGRVPEAQVRGRMG